MIEITPQIKKNLIERIGKMIQFKKGTVGKNAYRVSRVWKLGFHSFSNGENFIIRFCYLRTKRHTHYVQAAIKVCDKGESK